MGYKTILVHVNDERRLPHLLNTAISLALQHAAHVIAISVVPPIVIYPGSEASFAIPAIVESHRDAYRAEEARMKLAFETMMAERGVTSFEWQSLDGGTAATVADVVMPHTRTADIVIACQSNPTWHLSNMLDVSDRIATDSGRPVLIVPNTDKRRFVPKRVLVAWNGGREATRAVFDALPLLKQADEVAVAWIAEEGSAFDGDVASSQFCASLLRHGIKCHATPILNRHASAGEALLFEASNFGWDLLVMGCYGHSRMREFMLGGASRHVLANAKVPVLMAH